MSSAVATLPDSPIATGVATSAVRGWNGGRSRRIRGKELADRRNEEYAVRLRHDFSHADFLGFNLDLQRPMHRVHQPGNFG